MSLGAANANICQDLGGVTNEQWELGCSTSANYHPGEEDPMSLHLQNFEEKPRIHILGEISILIRFN